MVPYAPREAFGPQWGEPARSVRLPPMAGWYADYKERNAWLERHGLPVIIEEARVTPDGFVAIYVQAEDTCLPRSNVSRGFPLHVTLGFRGDYGEGVAELLVNYINGHWANKFYVFDIEWVGHGGAAMIRRTDPMYIDPLIVYLHDNGYYGARQMHVSL